MFYHFQCLPFVLEKKRGQSKFPQWIKVTVWSKGISHVKLFFNLFFPKNVSWSN